MNQHLTLDITAMATLNLRFGILFDLFIPFAICTQRNKDYYGTKQDNGRIPNLRICRYHFTKI